MRILEVEVSLEEGILNGEKGKERTEDKLLLHKFFP